VEDHNVYTRLDDEKGCYWVYISERERDGTLSKSMERLVHETWHWAEMLKKENAGTKKVFCMNIPINVCNT